MFESSTPEKIQIVNSFTVRKNIVTTWLFGAVNGHGAFYIKETNKKDSVRMLDPLIYGLQHGYWACRTKDKI